jgi:hypothetical protein|nr:MAG TPA: minor capsid protein [Caudoviricetes sp.]
MEDEKKKEEYDPYSVSDIFYQMEMDLVRSLQRNFHKHKMEERKLGFSWEMWQSAKLRNLENFRRTNRNIINRVRPAVSDIVEKVLTSYYRTGEENVTKQIELDNGSFSFPQNGNNTGEVNEAPPKETNFFQVNKKKLNALIESTKSDLDEAQYAVLRKMDDVYRQTVFKAEFQLSSGAVSLGKAIDMATEKFLEKGIDCIIYKNGARVNIASYAEMALRTASHRAQLLGEGAKRDEYGNHLVFVTAHANACKLCIPWQGQILIDDVFSHPNEEYIQKYKSKYKLLSEAIKSGLLHPNCRHGILTYFEGITRLPEPVPDDLALKNYNNEQKQRKLERAIRKQKRKVEGAVDEDNKKLERAKLRELQKEMREFLEEHPEFKRQNRREKIEPRAATLGKGNDADTQNSNTEYVETIDLKDVDSYISKYENEIKDYPVEHAYVIRKNGKVYHSIGDDIGVKIPLEDLEGSIVTHSHTYDGEPSNSFQKDDFSFLQDHGLKIKKLRAVYGNMRYEVQVKKDLSLVSYDDLYREVSTDIDIFSDFIDFGDLIFTLLDREGYVSYVKKKVE